MILPCIIMAMGTYLNNDIVSIIGFALLFVLIPLAAKIVNNHNKK